MWTLIINILKKYWLYIIMAVAIVVLFFMYRGANEAKEEYKNGYIGLQTEIVHYKDDKGRDVAKIESLELSTRTLRHLKDSTINNLIKENELMGIKLRKTERLIGLSTSTTDTIIVPLVDTIYVADMGPIAKLGQYNDGFLNLNIGVYDGLDSLYVSYLYKDNLVISGYWERDKEKFILIRWLYPKITYVAVKSLNPKTKIDNLRQVTFKKNKN